MHTNFILLSIIKYSYSDNPKGDEEYMESLDLCKFPEITLPRFIKVRQNLSSRRIEDIPSVVAEKIEPYLRGLEGKRIAIGVGSRGVSNIASITKSVIDNLIKAGASPFIIPVMGSHGGATPEGQAELLASYGITEKTMGVIVDASMEIETIGEYEPGFPVYVAKSALEADGIVIIPRVKPHTCFRGKIESGICKMLVIGLGKQIGADAVHLRGFDRFHELIPGIGRMIAEKTKVIFAVATVENGYEETCRIEVVPKEDIINLEREIELLEESKSLMAKILIPKFDVLVIEKIGKNISGDGQDPNVTGLYFTDSIKDGPVFQKCAIFDLTEETHGNGNGVGVADVITRELFDKLDFVKMYTNAFTSTVADPVKIPMVASTPEDALKIAVKMCNNVNPGEHKILWIKNTLELSEIIISEPLLKDIENISDIQIETVCIEVKFDNGNPIFSW